jgi:hypothetical protein
MRLSEKPITKKGLAEWLVWYSTCLTGSNPNAAKKKKLNNLEWKWLKGRTPVLQI